MTDTGQVPGEGLPESAGGQPGRPRPAATGTPDGAGHTVPSEAHSTVDTFPFPDEVHEDVDPQDPADDDLLLPGAQGAWGSEQPLHRQAASRAPRQTVPGQAGPRDAAVQAATGQQDTGLRRPLHLGPPTPDPTGGVVRSLADRGPATPTVPRAAAPSAPQAEPVGTETGESRSVPAEEPAEPVEAPTGALDGVAAPTHSAAPETAAAPGTDEAARTASDATPEPVADEPAQAPESAAEAQPAPAAGTEPAVDAGALPEAEPVAVGAPAPEADQDPPAAGPEPADASVAAEPVAPAQQPVPAPVTPEAAPAAQAGPVAPAAPQDGQTADAAQAPGNEDPQGAAAPGPRGPGETDPGVPADSSAPASPGAPGEAATPAPGPVPPAPVADGPQEQADQEETRAEPAAAPGDGLAADAAPVPTADGPAPTAEGAAEDAVNGGAEAPSAAADASPAEASAEAQPQVGGGGPEAVGEAGVSEAGPRSGPAGTAGDGAAPATQPAEGSGPCAPDAVAPPAPQGGDGTPEGAPAPATTRPEAATTDTEPTPEAGTDAPSPAVPDPAPQGAAPAPVAPGSEAPAQEASAAAEPEAPAATPAPEAPAPDAGATTTGPTHAPAEESGEQDAAAAEPGERQPEDVPLPGPDTDPAPVATDDAVGPAAEAAAREPAAAPADDDTAAAPDSAAPPAEDGATAPGTPAEPTERTVGADGPEATEEPAAPSAEAVDTAPDTQADPGAHATPDAPAAPGPVSQEAQEAPATQEPHTAVDADAPAEPVATASAATDGEAQPAPDAGAQAAPEASAAAPTEGADTTDAAPEANAAQDETGTDAPDSAADTADTADTDEAAGARESAPAGPPAPGYLDDEREAVHRVIRERRDIRNGFRSDPIPNEVLLRLLEAAHTAPSVGQSQPWDFVVIRSPETRERMHELAMRQREEYAKSLPKARAKQFRQLKIEAIKDTPINLVVTADPTRGGRHTLGRHTQPQMAPYSSALAVENLWLAARAEGIGVGWVSFFDERELVRELGLPEHLEIVAYLCIGYVEEFPGEPELTQAGWSRRRPLSWVVHEEEYGRRGLPGEAPHDLLEETLRGIRPLDAKALGEAWERQKRMTKPAGALGMLEIISAQLCGLSRKCPPPIPEPAAVAIFAGDHGVHAQGVTPWPQEVTGQMVANFLGGGAVCNAFANQVGAEVCVVDVGVAADLPTTPGLVPRKVRPGTDDFTAGPAMSHEDVLKAIEVGIETARDLVAAGNKALLTGEMGIANTTTSAALISVYTGADPVEVTGRGTGITDETHARKVDVVRRALDLHQPDPADPLGVLAAVGGLEHAAMVGLILGGASLRTPVILDGVSAGAAALVARAVAPEALAACIAGHRSAEPGHVAALNRLGLRPLVDLDLRLGEGTGALLALPLVQSAARAMHEVATFDTAGVTEKS